MELSDGSYWLLSGLVGLLLVANGVVRIPGGSTPLDLALAGFLIVGGLLAGSNAVVGVRDPDAFGEDYWTLRKTVLNAVAVLVLAFALVANL